MNKHARWGGCILMAAALLFSPAFPVFSQPSAVQEAETLLQEARDLGKVYIQSKDKKTGKNLKKKLAGAEKVLKRALKKDKGCEPCLEKLVETQVLEAYFGFSDRKKCCQAVSKARESYPDNTRLTLLHGYALFNAGEWADSVKTLKEYLLFSSGNPATEKQAQDLLRAAQERFLNAWYRHANWYNSNKARLQVMDPATYKMNTIVQITPEWEAQVGNQAFSQMVGQAPEVRIPEVTTYLTRLVTRLVDNSQGPHSGYTVTVVDSPEINAMTVPGHVMVNAGLISFAENEAQLVGVLAHELGHNYGHHAARRYLKAVQGQQLTGVLLQAVQNKKKVAPLAELGAALGLDIFLKAYSRHEEREADHYGSHIAFNAGYDPTAMSTFFLKLYKHNPKQPIRWLSTHPPTPRRIEYMTDYMDSFPLDREVRTDSQEFRQVRGLVSRSSGTGAPAQGRGVLPPP